MKRFDYETPMLEVIYLSEDVVRTSDVKFGADEDEGEEYW